MPARRFVATALAAVLTATALAQQSDNLNWRPPAGARGAGDFLASNALFEAGLVKHWQVTLPLAAGQRIESAYLVDDQIYAGTNDGYVFAVHAPTGAVRWVRNYTRGGYPLRRPAHVGIRTVIATPPDITQYDRQYGKPIRRQQLAFPSGTPPVSDGLSVMIGGLDRRMYSFGPDADYERWKIGADSQLVSCPTLRGEHLYFASDNGTIYGTRAADKAFYWVNRSIGPVTADLVSDDRGIYVASRDRSLYLLDPDFGGTLWRVRLSGPLEEPPVPTPDLAFQYSPLDGLVVIDSKSVNADDRVRWTLENGRRLLTIDDKNAYILTRDEKIVVCDLESGTVRHEIPAAGFTMPLPFTTLPVVYVASPDGRIFAARKRGTRVVTADSVRAAMDVAKAVPEAPAAEAEEQPELPIGEDVLGSRQAGPPIGGKSKVSKEFPRQRDEP